MEGRPFHFIAPEAEEPLLQTALLQAFSLEGEPCVKLYLYVDDAFAFKTKACPRSANPEIAIDIDM